MHQRGFERPEWADIFEEAYDIHQRHLGMWLVTTARHPDLGAITAIEDEQSMVMVFAENPFEARDPNYRLDEAA